MCLYSEMHCSSGAISMQVNLEKVFLNVGLKTNSEIKVKNWCLMQKHLVRVLSQDTTVT